MNYKNLEFLVADFLVIVSNLLVFSCSVGGLADKIISCGVKNYFRNNLIVEPVLIYGVPMLGILGLIVMAIKSAWSLSSLLAMRK